MCQSMCLERLRRLLNPIPQWEHCQEPGTASLPGSNGMALDFALAASCLWDLASCVFLAALMDSTGISRSRPCLSV